MTPTPFGGEQHPTTNGKRTQRRGRAVAEDESERTKREIQGERRRRETGAAASFRSSRRRRWSQFLVAARTAASCLPCVSLLFSMKPTIVPAAAAAPAATTSCARTRDHRVAPSRACDSRRGTS